MTIIADGNLHQLLTEKNDNVLFNDLLSTNEKKKDTLTKINISRTIRVLL